MTYKGYTIEHNKFGYYIVTGPGGIWSADSVQEAKADIDDMEAEADEEEN